MIVYLDTSAVLRVLLRQPHPLQEWGQWKHAFTSELMGVEARRSIDRLRLDNLLDDNGVALTHGQLSQLERGLGRIRITRLVLSRASLPMATRVKTLDAIHVATALLLREHKHSDIVFATHDEQQATAATAMGFVCLGM